MFDVRAVRDAIIIKGMDIHAKSGEVTVTIYTKSGTHVGYNKDPSKWYLVLPPTEVQGMGRNKRTPLPKNKFLSVSVPSRGTQAFYVTLSAPNIRYTPETDLIRGDVFVSNQDIEFLAGSGVGTRGFGGIFSPRVWNGVIHYQVADPSNSAVSTGKAFATLALKEPTKAPTFQPTLQPTLQPTFHPTNHPTDKPITAPISPPRNKVSLGSSSTFFRGMSTDFLGDNGSYGNMFDVTATSEDVIIHGLDTHVRTEDVVVARVWYREGSYQGFEYDQDSWRELLSETQISGNGFLNPTPLPSQDFSPVIIQAGETISFYVTFTTKVIRYTNWSGSKPSYIDNDHIMVHMGVGVGGYPFGQTFKNRFWNGIIWYGFPSDIRRLRLRNVEGGEGHLQ